MLTPTRASSSSKSRCVHIQPPFSRTVSARTRLLTMRCAQEYYADYWALDSALVSLELENNVACFMPQTWESQVRRCCGVRFLGEPSDCAYLHLAPCQPTQRMYDRIVDGIAAVLLTLKKRPVIRYSYTCVPMHVSPAAMAR